MPIKGCRECKFNKSGSFLAATNGNSILIYDFHTGEKIADLRGHNSKVDSAYASHYPYQYYKYILLTGSLTQLAGYGMLSHELRTRWRCVLMGCRRIEKVSSESSESSHLLELFIAISIPSTADDAVMILLMYTIYVESFLYNMFLG